MGNVRRSLSIDASVDKSVSDLSLRETRGNLSKMVGLLLCEALAIRSNPSMLREWATLPSLGEPPKVSGGE